MAHEFLSPAGWLYPGREVRPRHAPNILGRSNVWLPVTHKYQWRQGWIRARGLWYYFALGCSDVFWNTGRTLAARNRAHAAVLLARRQGHTAAAAFVARTLLSAGVWRQLLVDYPAFRNLTVSALASFVCEMSAGIIDAPAGGEGAEALPARENAKLEWLLMQSSWLDGLNTELARGAGIDSLQLLMQPQGNFERERTPHAWTVELWDVRAYEQGQLLPSRALEANRSALASHLRGADGQPCRTACWAACCVACYNSPTTLRACSAQRGMDDVERCSRTCGAADRRALAAAGAQLPSTRPGRGQPEARQPPRFYMHEGEALDHAWLEGCPGFAALRGGPSVENMAEVSMRALLARHPRRTRAAAAASAFYIPVYEYVSWALGTVDLARCAAGGGGNTTLDERLATHAGRMSSAHAALRASAAWLRCSGCDHLFATTLPATGPPRGGEKARLGHGLAGDLGCATGGRMKAPMGPSAVGGCSVEIPYDTLARGASVGADRRHRLVYFAGSLDVCCSGKATRCAVAQLMALRAPDVLIRPTVRVRGGGGECTLLGLTLAANASAPAPMMVSNAIVGPHATAEPAVGVDGAAVLHRREMEESRFCLVPAGDTFVSSRLYSAIAAGCIPVLISDGFSGANPEHADYDSFAIRVPQREFQRAPHLIVDKLRNVSDEELTARQRQLERHARDVLYSDADSRVADHFLEAAAGCLARQRTAPCARSLPLRRYGMPSNTSMETLGVSPEVQQQRSPMSREFAALAYIAAASGYNATTPYRNLSRTFTGASPQGTLVVKSKTLP